MHTHTLAHARSYMWWLRNALAEDPGAGAETDDPIEPPVRWQLQDIVRAPRHPYLASTLGCVRLALRLRYLVLPYPSEFYDQRVRAARRSASRCERGCE